MTLLGPVRESWPSMVSLDHVELKKTLWHFLAGQETAYSNSRPRGVDKNAKTFRKEKQKQKQKWKSKWKQN